MASTQNYTIPSSHKPCKGTDPLPDRSSESLEKRSPANSATTICSSSDIGSNSFLTQAATTSSGPSWSARVWQS
jgi:hypothetical protein